MCKVAAANLAAYSNAINASFFATYFVRRSFVALFFALDLAEASGKFDNVIRSLSIIGISLTGASVAGYCVFFSFINKGYVHTFFSFETGGQMAIRTFRTLDDEGLKAEAVFKKNKNLWKSVRGEVKEWVWQNWPTWIETNPPWLEEKMKSMIPLDMIPSLTEQKKIRAKRLGKAKKGGEGGEAPKRGIMASLTRNVFGEEKSKREKRSKKRSKQRTRIVQKEGSILKSMSRAFVRTTSKTKISYVKIAPLIDDNGFEEGEEEDAEENIDEMVKSYVSLRF